MEHENHRLSALPLVSELALMDSTHKLTLACFKEWVNSLNKIFLHLLPLRELSSNVLKHEWILFLLFVCSFLLFLCVGGLYAQPNCYCCLKFTRSQGPPSKLSGHCARIYCVVRNEPCSEEIQLR